MSMPALFKGRLSIPAIGAPLFIISVPDLVIAQCKAGIVGSFPALNARPPELLDEWLTRIREALAAHDAAHPERPSAPFAVNQIVHRSNNRLEHDLALCEKHKVPIIITSLGAREDLNAAVKGWGGVTLHDIIDDIIGNNPCRDGERDAAERHIVAHHSDLLVERRVAGIPRLATNARSDSFIRGFALPVFPGDERRSQLTSTPLS